MSMVIANPVETLHEVRFTKKEREFVYRVALKYLGDVDTAHDVAQEALLLAFRYRHRFLGKARFTTWLYRIAATSALMHLRRERRRRGDQLLSLDEGRSMPEPRSGQPSPEELASARETLDLCQRAVAEMRPTYQPVFRLRFVHGLSDVEVAHQLGLNHNTEKTRAHRARKYVKRRLVRERDERSQS
jgi:RNA polymerase sigma-70 factor (ECF subfamily)